MIASLEQVLIPDFIFLDVVIQRLSIADAKLVDDLWAHKSRFSLGCTLYQIEHLPTFGVYWNGQLVSWTLTLFTGSFGMSFTLPEFRRL
ncbi:unnamed protein product, partial [Rotaria sp. Silwood1]